jgi:hypothetical protein
MTDQTNPKTCGDCDIALLTDLLFWDAAYNSWNETGNKSYIIEGLRNNRPIPHWAREFIADIIEDKTKPRQPILEKANNERRNLFIKNGYIFYKDYFKKKKSFLHRGETPRSAAIAELANIYDLKESYIRDIIYEKK